MMDERWKKKKKKLGQGRTSYKGQFPARCLGKALGIRCCWFIVDEKDRGVGCCFPYVRTWRSPSSPG